jgi:hypothetical protein
MSSSYYRNTNALRAKILENNPPIAKVVDNAASIVEDLRSIKNLQKQISKVSKKSIEALDQLDTNMFSALAVLCDQFKETVCSYLYTHDSKLSPMSEISSSKKFNRSNFEKNPDMIKTRLASEYDIPSMPGNLFYLATGKVFSQTSPDLYSQFVSARASYANRDKSDSELIVEFFPKYAFPGYGSLSQTLKTKLDNTFNPVIIKENPDEDLSYIIPLLGLRNTTEYEKFLSIMSLDAELKKIDLEKAYKGISLFTQLGLSRRHRMVWLLNLKILVGSSSVVDTFLLYMLGRASLDEGSDFKEILDWLLGQDPLMSSDPTDSDLLREIQTDPGLAAAFTTSSNFVSESLYLVKSKLSSQSAAFSTFSGWKQSLNLIGREIGSQAIILLVCIACIERIKVLSNYQNPTEEEIKKLCQQGIRFSGYLFNAGPLKTAFQALGG